MVCRSQAVAAGPGSPSGPREAAACLTWLGAEKVQNPAKYREKLRQEETAYQEELSRCLKRLTEEE